MSSLKKLQKKIKIDFKDEKILLKAITHKSFDPNNKFGSIDDEGI